MLPRRVTKKAAYLEQVVSVLPQYSIVGLPFLKNNLVVSRTYNVIAPSKSASQALVEVHAEGFYWSKRGVKWNSVSPLMIDPLLSCTIYGRGKVGARCLVLGTQYFC